MLDREFRQPLDHWFAVDAGAHRHYISRVLDKLTELRVRGVARTAFDSHGAAIKRELLVQEGRDIEVRHATTAAPTAKTPVRLLTSVAQVHALPPEEARRGYPVSFSGIVTAPFEIAGALFVQDASGGIYLPQPRGTFTSGETVTVTGVTGAGDFAPVVRDASVRITGKGRLPAAARPPLPDLFTGAFDSQWIEAEGIVQTVASEQNQVRMALVNGRYRFTAEVPAALAGDAARLADAKVRIRGACASVFNERRQLLGIRLIVPDSAAIDIIETGQADPWSLPVERIETLMQYRMDSRSGHRVRMQGTVIHAVGDTFYMTDASGGVVVQTADAFGRTGDHVEGRRVSGRRSVPARPGRRRRTARLERRSAAARVHHRRGCARRQLPRAARHAGGSPCRRVVDHQRTHDDAAKRTLDVSGDVRGPPG